MIREFAHVRCMTAKAEGLVFSCGRSQEGVERGTERRRMNRVREGRGFPLFKHTLMAAFTFTGARKGLFDGSLRLGSFLREQAATEPRREEQRHHNGHRTD